MPHVDVQTVLWRFKHWRCEYAPESSIVGSLTVYAGEQAILERKCGPGMECHELATSFRALIEISDHRKNATLQPN